MSARGYAKDEGAAMAATRALADAANNRESDMNFAHMAAGIRAAHSAKTYSDLAEEVLASGGTVVVEWIQPDGTWKAGDRW